MNCPKCGTPLVPIIYGSSSAEGYRLIATGERYQGGCRIRPLEEPTHGCCKCHYAVLVKDSDEYRDLVAMHENITVRARALKP